MNKLNIYINKLSTFKFIILSSVIAYISTIPFSIIASYINYDVGFNEELELPLVFSIFIAIFLVPIIESGIILLIIRGFSKIFKNKLNIVFMSAIVFSCFHYYSLIYIFAIFIPSYIFIGSYLFYKPKDKHFNPITVMTSIHMLYNLYNILFSKLF